MANRIEISDEELENVSGGLFSWDYPNQVMTFLRADGTTTQHEIIDYNNAWYWSNKYHAENVPEEEILRILVERGFVKA